MGRDDILKLWVHPGCLACDSRTERYPDALKGYGSDMILVGINIALPHDSRTAEKGKDQLSPPRGVIREWKGTRSRG